MVQEISSNVEFLLCGHSIEVQTGEERPNVLEKGTMRPHLTTLRVHWNG